MGNLDVQKTGFPNRVWSRFSIIIISSKLTFRPETPPFLLTSIMSRATFIISNVLLNIALKMKSLCNNNWPKGSIARIGSKYFCSADGDIARLALAITGSSGLVWQSVLTPNADDMITSRVSPCWYLQEGKET